MDTVIVVMQKSAKTGMFEKELKTLSIAQNYNFILNIYGMEDEKKEITIYLKLTTERDILDWEFDAVYDYYDTDIFKEDVINIIECEDEYNPTWEISFKYDEETELMENKINFILQKHKQELEDVFNTIKNKEGEYKDEK